MILMYRWIESYAVLAPTSHHTIYITDLYMDVKWLNPDNIIIMAIASLKTCVNEIRI